MQGLHGSAPGPLRIYYGFHVQINGFLLLVPTLEPFSFCLFVLRNSCAFVFVLPYYIFKSCFIYLFIFNFYPLGACLFNNERHKNSGS